MNLTNVLVISGGGFQGLALVKALRSVKETRILLADCYPENVSRYFADAFFLAPMLAQEHAFLNFALTLCERENVKAVFASTEYELKLLARNRDAFERQGAIVYVSDIGLLELAGDKLVFYHWLLKEGLPCLPCYASPRDGEAVLPLIGKPRWGWGGRGIRVLSDQEALSAISVEENNQFVWQPYLDEFEEYSIDFSVDVVGEVSPLAFRRRVRSLGGFAILCEPGAPLHVQNAAGRVLDCLVPLGARGPMNMQILSRGESCWVSDLNPRAGTSMPMSLAMGSNPLAFLLEKGGLSGKQPAIGNTIGDRTRTLRYLEEKSVPDLRLENIRGAVFDLDDTLLDQKAWMFSKLELTWDEAKSILPERSTFLSLVLQLIEEGNRAKLFDALCAKLGLDDTVRLMLIETYRKMRPQDDLLYRDVRPALYQLRRLGYRIGVLTDNPPASQRQKLEVCGLNPLLDSVVLAEELETQKPDRMVFDECARLLGLPPEQLVMIGDNLFRDIQGSFNAGYKHAFHIQRAGTFFNFNPDLASRAGHARSACTSIASLNELFWYLTEVQKQ